MKIKKKEIAQMAAVLGIGIAVAAGVGIWKDKTSVVTGLARNSSGEGSYTVDLEAQVEGEENDETFTVEIPEQTYAEDTVEERLEQAEESLPELVLNDNSGFDCVTSDLNFAAKIPDSGIRISWTVSDYTVLDSTGQIVIDDPGESGTSVTIAAELSYGSHRRTWNQEVTVCRNELTQSDELFFKLQEILDNGAEENTEEQNVELPSEVNGKQIVWRKGGDHTAEYVMVLAVILAALIPAKRYQTEKETHAKREAELKSVYPDLARRFQLYIGAGMSIRNAFRKLSEDYEREKGANAYVSVELQRIVREMESGISEAQCYENFGERCQLSCYRRFASILAQNLRKGTKGMKELLKKEADEAFEERKALARRRGEEAGTKLLGPMFLMLATVLIIVIVPAFLSIQM